jgi:hypothetical protein
VIIIIMSTYKRNLSCHYKEKEGRGVVFYFYR